MRDSKLRRLVKIMEESGIESLEIPYFFRTIKISRKMGANGQGSPSAVIIGPSTPATPPTPSLPTGPTTEFVAEAPKKDATGFVAITSPMVGTFYRAPSPDAAPFIDIGSRVTAGTTVCLIEAMKLMNEIEAEVAGVIKEILVPNGSPVEYGQTLFLIDPRG